MLTSMEIKNLGPAGFDFMLTQEMITTVGALYPKTQMIMKTLRA